MLLPDGASTLLTRSVGTWAPRCRTFHRGVKNHTANPALCPSAQSLPLRPLTTCLWERDPPVLSLFYLWTALYIHGDTIMWIIKWNAGPACAAEVSEAESIYSSWETAQMYLFSFFAPEIWTLHFLLHEKTLHNDYFGGSFPIRSGLSFLFSEFILKSGQNLLKMLYLPVSCILTKRRKKTPPQLFI